MKFFGTLLLAALAVAGTEAVQLNQEKTMSQESQDQINDLYSYGERDNIKAEIEEAKMYMEKKRRAEAQD